MILGTRPEIIKLAPIIRECEKGELDYFIIHTGQHYSYEMDKVFFEELELPSPKYNLNAGLDSFRKQVGVMVGGISGVLKNEKPDYVLVLGDVNSVLAGALSSNKLNIKLCHIEAGLRSHDIKMLEETNRIIVDHISDYLFTPTETAKKNLLEEGISKTKIILTGNTIVDSVYQNLELANKKFKYLTNLKLNKNSYFVLTTHRPENADIKDKLEELLKGIGLVYEEFKLPIIYPIHPRTKKMLEKYDLKLPKGITRLEPIGYLEFLQLISKAKLILTDSGGLQEEACILKIPCVTLRENTERQETLEERCNILAGTNPNNILECSKKMINKERAWKNLYGDGKSAERIINFLKNQ
jgi:UDP-N-acetylglucosamine 2-epimerase (non-hydrolysing)